MSALKTTADQRALAFGAYLGRDVNGATRPAEAESRQRTGIGHPGHHVPRAPVHNGHVHPHQHLVLSDHGPVDFLDARDVLGRGAILVLPIAVMGSRPVVIVGGSSRGRAVRSSSGFSTTAAAHTSLRRT